MKFPRIEVGYNIVFNNTGFDWTYIQDALCEIEPIKNLTEGEDKI